MNKLINISRKNFRLIFVVDNTIHISKARSIGINDVRPKRNKKALYNIAFMNLSCSQINFHKSAFINLHIYI